MKFWIKRLLIALLGVAVYSVTLVLGAIVFVNVNVATVFWGNIFPIFVLLVACLGGGIFWVKAYGLREAPEYDLELLKHEVINQLEADFEENYFESMDGLFQTMIDRGYYDLLYDFIGETAQENLKEGLTAKRW